MAHFNDSDSFYPPSTIPDEFDSYLPLWRQVSANPEGVDLQPTPTFTNGWDMVSQPGSSAIPSTSSPLTSYESSFPTLGSYPDPSQAPYWPTISQTTQDHPGMLSWENPFASSYGWETVMQTLTPNPVQTDFWSSQQYPAPNDVPYAGNLQNHPQPGPSAAKTGVTDRRRFAPYDTYYGNAEVAPSAQLPPPIPHGTQPTTQPIGGTPETTADAEQNQPMTEEDETPAPRTQRPCDEGVARPHRERNHKDVLKLRTWAKALRGRRGLPSHQDAIAAAAEIISVFWQPVYDEDQLSRGHGRRTGAGWKEADEERERRNGTRQVYRRLSRYYRLEEGRSTWNMTQLLSRVLKDLDNLDDALRNAFASA